MSELDVVHAEIAKYVRVIPGIGAVYYPAPNSISGANTAIVYAGDLDITHGGEMYLALTSRVILYLAPTDTAKAISDADSIALTVVDQFAPDNPGFHLTGLVDFCQVVRVELSRVLEYAGHTYFCAVFYLRLKIRRFAGGGYPIV